LPDHRLSAVEQQRTPHVVYNRSEPVLDAQLRCSGHIASEQRKTAPADSSRETASSHAAIIISTSSRNILMAVERIAT